jgi:hypothetical protein
MRLYADVFDTSISARMLMALQVYSRQHSASAWPDDRSLADQVITHGPPISAQHRRPIKTDKVMGWLKGELQPPK